MILDKSTRDYVLFLQKDKKIFLEGNILKVIESAPDDLEFKEYLDTAVSRDKDGRRRRLEVTKQIQNQNHQLLKSQEENQQLMDDLKLALIEAEDARQAATLAMEEAESAKKEALNDLDILQKRTQTELIGTIVKVALFVIMGVGVITTALYIIAIFNNKDTQIIGSTWSNMFGILLTNAFSIVGTIMGVKYASEGK
jgi:hypothetical protein